MLGHVPFVTMVSSSVSNIQWEVLEELIILLLGIGSMWSTYPSCQDYQCYQIKIKKWRCSRQNLQLTWQCYRIHYARGNSHSDNFHHILTNGKLHLWVRMNHGMYLVSGIITSTFFPELGCLYRRREELPSWRWPDITVSETTSVVNENDSPHQGSSCMYVNSGGDTTLCCSKRRSRETSAEPSSPCWEQQEPIIPTYHIRRSRSDKEDLVETTAELLQVFPASVFVFWRSHPWSEPSISIWCIPCSSPRLQLINRDSLSLSNNSQRWEQHLQETTTHWRNVRLDFPPGNTQDLLTPKPRTPESPCASPNSLFQHLTNHDHLPYFSCSYPPVGQKKGW